MDLEHKYKTPYFRYNMMYETVLLRKREVSIDGPKYASSRRNTNYVTILCTKYSCQCL